MTDKFDKKTIKIIDGLLTHILLDCFLKSNIRGKTVDLEDCKKYLIKNSNTDIIDALKIIKKVKNDKNYQNIITLAISEWADMI